MELDQPLPSPNRAQGLRSPNTDSGNQPTTQVASGTNMGKHPQRQSVAPGKSTKMLSLQPTHQLDACSGATPAGALGRTRCRNKKFPCWQHENRLERFYLNRPEARGLHPRVRSRAPVVEKKISPVGNTKTPRTILPESPGDSGATPVAALARTHCYNEKSPSRFYPNRPGAWGLLSGS